MSGTGGSKPLLMSLPAFAAHLSISLSTLRRRVDEGIIPVLHEGRRVSVPVAIAEKRYMAYLLEREKEYRVAKRSEALSEPAAPRSLSDRAADIAEQVGLLAHSTTAGDRTDRGARCAEGAEPQEVTAGAASASGGESEHRHE